MTQSAQITRRPSIGAEVTERGVQFRVWAPRRKAVHLVIVKDGQPAQPISLSAEFNGYFAAKVESAGPGTRYAFQFPGDERLYPDPASRFQPEGVHQASEVIDPRAFRWHDQDWPGLTLPGQVIYEVHVGTFTPEGTWAAAQEKLPFLAKLGVTTLEVMPVAEFVGQFGWGYDGVYWFAPTRLYGRPDDFRAFIDAAHALRLGVILDVVYNHLGPTGNYMGQYSDDYLSKLHHTDWGSAINYDGPNAAHVREYVAANAAYWIRDFHLDGFRFDATQTIVDESQPHILADAAVAAREAAADRSIILIAENDEQDVRHVARVEDGGFGFDGMWNDDFHHTCRVAATGHAEFYYADFTGQPQELISTARWGFLYQGQWSKRKNDVRGTPAGHLAAHRFVNCLQNHDQVSNSAHGLRGYQLTSPGRYRALTALLLLAPGTPMLFMGQEFMASAPFPFFADHEVDLAALVREGRREYLRRFPRIAAITDTQFLTDPCARATFESAKLDWNECNQNTAAVQLHRDLLELRRTDPAFARQDANNLHGAVIGDEAFLLRWFYGNDEDRLLIVNLERDYCYSPIAEPLLAPPRDSNWQLLWASDDPKYGGTGTALLDTSQWFIPGHAAVVLRPVSTSKP